MPINVTVLHQIDDSRIRSQLERLYSQNPEFNQPDMRLLPLEQAVKQGAHLYIATFNDKIIGAVCSSPQSAADTRLLHLLGIHPANHNRGVAEHLLAMACRLDQKDGIRQFVSPEVFIQQILQHSDW